MIGLTILSSKDFKQLFKEAFDKLFDGLHRYAFSLLQDKEQAYDVLQVVFIKWWETKKEMDDQSVKFYLYTAVYRQCLNTIRNEKTKEKHYKNFGMEQSGNSSESIDGMEVNELERKIRDVILELPTQCRSIFEKSRFENKRYMEIANEMNLSIKTVEAQMGKALKILRDRLKEYL